MLEKLRNTFKSTGTLPTNIVAVIHSWSSGSLGRNHALVLEQVLAEHGREIYDSACTETFKVLRKRFNTQSGTHIHILVNRGQFILQPAIRPGQGAIPGLGQNFRIEKEIHMGNTREIRFLSGAEVRAKAGNILQGYSAIFNSPSGDLGGFTEVIAPGTFSRALREKQDVVCLVNHNASLVLGRTTSGTLKLAEDSVGLEFQCTLPDTSVARDVYKSIDRGDISGCSFGFVKRSDVWRAGDPPLRTLTDVDLSDVSVVTFPAYSSTTVSARDLWPSGVPLELRSYRTNPEKVSCYVYSTSEEQRVARIQALLEKVQPDYRRWNFR